MSKGIHSTSLSDHLRRQFPESLQGVWKFPDQKNQGCSLFIGFAVILLPVGECPGVHMQHFRKETLGEPQTFAGISNQVPLDFGQCKRLGFMSAQGYPTHAMLLHGGNATHQITENAAFVFFHIDNPKTATFAFAPARIHPPYLAETACALDDISCLWIETKSSLEFLEVIINEIFRKMFGKCRRLDELHDLLYAICV